MLTNARIRQRRRDCDARADRKIRCPDCRKWTDTIDDACNHCGCPLSAEALAGLVEGIAAIELGDSPC